MKIKLEKLKQQSKEYTKEENQEWDRLMLNRQTAAIKKTVFSFFIKTCCIFAIIILVILYMDQLIK